MYILIITPSYEPDLGPSAPLFTMLSSELAHRKHKVTVITAVPHYPSGTVPSSFRGRFVQNSIENNVEVIRVAIPSLNRANFIYRLLQFICFQIGATWVSLNQKFDVAIIPNPALQTWLPFTWSVIIRRKPVIFSIHDVYPDVGINLGIFKHKLVISIVTTLERFCLNHAMFVRILSDSFRPGLHKLGVAESKIRLIYDWVDTYLIRPLPHDNSFTQEYGLTGCFIVLYAGNIGLSQGLESVLAAAKLLANENDLRFVFVGQGSGKGLLQSQVEREKLVNVQFIPFQPRERLPEVLASADVSLVILKRRIGLDSLPSKTFSIMASGRPLLVSVDEESETWKLVERANAGLCVPPEDPSKLVEAISTLKQDKILRESLGHNGRIWAEQHHSPQFAAEQFERLLFEAIQGNK
jgi:colanic acid biosynthesis glycosyl transferase WcaI